MPRYKSSRIVINDSEFYKFLRDKRGLKKVKHYNTPIIYNPTVADRNAIDTVTHVWSYGDRYYKLAAQYYGAPEYWWVIAWWNGRPTEATIQNGTAIQIPLVLENALQIMGTY